MEISWERFRELGVWSKPGGAPFLCIEPWRGFASPADFDGEFSDKPGVMQIAPRAKEIGKLPHPHWLIWAGTNGDLLLCVRSWHL